MKNSKVLTLGALAVLAACHQGSDQKARPAAAPKVNAPAAAQRGRSPQELTAGMVEAVSAGKSQTRVALKFELAKRPTVGEPLEIAIALMSQIPATPATIAVSTGEGLQLAGEGRIEIPSVEPSQVYREIIKVTPSAEGVQFVTFDVMLSHDEVVDSRQFLVPVIVAAAATSVAATPVSPAESPVNAATSPVNAATSPVNGANQHR